MSGGGGGVFGCFRGCRMFVVVKVVLLIVLMSLMVLLMWLFSKRCLILDGRGGDERRWMVFFCEWRDLFVG